MADSATSVTFTVKELLVDVKAELGVISGKLDNKVDKADFVQLAARVADLEMHKKSLDDKKEWKRWVIPIGVGTFMSVISPFLWVLASHA